MDQRVTCLLCSLDPSYSNITLWSTDAVVLGRSSDTRIKDKRCSKQQVEVRCDDFLRGCLSVRQLGCNASAVNGLALTRGVPVTARHHDVIEILVGQYKYKVEFDPPPPSSSTVNSNNISTNCSRVETETNGLRKTESNSKKTSTKHDLEKPGKERSSVPVPIKSVPTAGRGDQLTSSSTAVGSVRASQGSSVDRSSGSSSSSTLRETAMARRRAGGGAVKTIAVTTEGNSGTTGATSSKRTAPTSDGSGPAAKKAKAASAAVSNCNSDVGAGGSSSSGSWASLHGGDLLVYNQCQLPGAEKVAGYDMDGTLILTQSGKVFATDYNDWRIIFTEVPGKLKSLVQQGYKIVIFTNQAGIGTGKHTPAGVQGKITRIIAKLGVPVQVFISTGRGKFRKPAPYMWEFMEQHCNGGVKVQRSSSLYVGDAAGRPAAAGGRKKDFSTADRLFALNLGMPFQTPEEHFLDRKTETFKMPEFDPRNLSMTLPLYDPADTKVPAHPTELIVLVGHPGSGKSVFATATLTGAGFQHANRDTLGSWQKCAAVVQRSLQAGQSVVVDNTNPDRDSRGRYIKIAASMKVPARCFLMNVSKDHARHNNKFREFTNPSHSKVSDMVFNMYGSKFQMPETKEGFTDIVKVNFVPNFKNNDDQELYRMFLLEK